MCDIFVKMSIKMGDKAKEKEKERHKRGVVAVMGTYEDQQSKVGAEFQDPSTLSLPSFLCSFLSPPTCNFSFFILSIIPQNFTMM